MFGVFRPNIKTPTPSPPGGGVNSSEDGRPQDTALYSICIVSTLRLLVYIGKIIGLNIFVRQARVRFSARHHREGLPTELSSDEEMERGPSEW